ncbi:MAG: CCA tRNA nucleotidyltransferase [bacterium]|nr:CCA tRNA nucleotidyltransferase [bacterium]
MRRWRRRPEGFTSAPRSHRKSSPLTLAIPERFRPGIEIVRRLREAGWETYLVGGVVRDLLLGRPPVDLDIATAAPPDRVAALFDRTVPVGVQFGVVAVVLDGYPYQVATFRREGPYLDGRRPAYVEQGTALDDVRRRDFTVNALLYDPFTGEIIDHVGGRADLAGRCIRTVGPAAERFAEDRLRLLRAVRLAAELQFTVEPDTRAALADLAPTITGVSAERIRDELVRLLVAPDGADGVLLMASTGLLGAVLPEVAALSSRPPPHADGPALDALDHACRVLRSLGPQGPVLAVAAILCGIPDAAAAGRVCRRLRFPTAERREIVILVGEFQRLSGGAHLSAADARRVQRQGVAAGLLELLRADLEATGSDPAAYLRDVRLLAAAAMAASEPDRLITGDDLIAMGYVPGPAFSVMLRAIEEAQVRGEVASTESARAWIHDHFPAGTARPPVEPA